MFGLDEFAYGWTWYYVVTSSFLRWLVSYGYMSPARVPGLYLRQKDTRG